MTIFDYVDRIRASLSEEARGGVSPNHVLVPAAVWHSCPADAPDVPDSPGTMPGPESPPVRVTVIDSGWYWDPGWEPTNPVAPRVAGRPPTEWLDPAGGSGWVQEPPDQLSYDNRHNWLDALVGHANFVAGVVAMECPNATITVRSHNGGFDPTSDGFPTEASVARSLVRAFLEDDPQVVDVGFAFACLDDAVTCVWETAFRFLPHGTMVVAPAGNRGMTDVFFPAGLDYAHRQTHPGDARFANMLGVASFHQNGEKRHELAVEPSSWTNRGPWVACSTVGEGVVSSFLDVNRKVEEDPAGPARDFKGWAVWDGTSFAAPRIVARLANAIVAGAPDAQAAWQALAVRLPPDPELGRELTRP